MSLLSRRSFFQGAALAASAGRVAGANDRINVGIVGLGGRGTAHLGYYSKISTCRIAGLCDVNQAARERAQARLQKTSRRKPRRRNTTTCASCSPTRISTPSPSPRPTTGTRWPPSGPARPARTSTWRSRPATTCTKAGAWWRWRGRPSAWCRSARRAAARRTRSRPCSCCGMASSARSTWPRGCASSGANPSARRPTEPVPAGLDWDMFLGPAPMRPFTKNRFAYNWHWFWDTGNGDIGNQGVHEMDIVPLGSGRRRACRSRWSRRAASTSTTTTRRRRTRSSPPSTTAGGRSSSRCAGC